MQSPKFKAPLYPCRYGPMKGKSVLLNNKLMKCMPKIPVQRYFPGDMQERMEYSITLRQDFTPYVDIKQLVFIHLAHIVGSTMSSLPGK